MDEMGTDDDDPGHDMGSVHESVFLLFSKTKFLTKLNGTRSKTITKS